jgi:septum site-determining protein MinC
MSKITIVSREDQALLIDISGCTSFKEAIEQLSSTFLSANKFWQDQTVDLNLGSLVLSKAQVVQLIALLNGVGAQTKHIFARSASTFSALEELQLPISKEPDTVLSVSVMSEEHKLGKSLSAVNSADLKEKNNHLHKERTLTTEAKNNEIENSAQLLPLGVNDLSSTTELEASENLLPKSDTELENKKKNSLYLKQTLRAGQAVSHKGDLIIIGDVNAGAEVMAEGDITIWGSLRGIAHAGINGNTKAEIRALRLQPIQIRIADAIARSPDSRARSASQDHQSTIETAKLINGKIRIMHKTFD